MHDPIPIPFAATADSRPALLVSACLLGAPVRCDGTAKPLPEGTQASLAHQWQLIAVCPERLGGLPTPRPAAEISRRRRAQRAGGPGPGMRCTGGLPYRGLRTGGTPCSGVGPALRGPACAPQGPQPVLWQRDASMTANLAVPCVPGMGSAPPCCARRASPYSANKTCSTAACQGWPKRCPPEPDANRLKPRDSGAFTGADGQQAQDYALSCRSVGSSACA